MFTLEESKKIKLPASFITDFIAKGWGEIGLLNDQIKSFQQEFTGGSKVITILQQLVDNYLICVGQLEQLLAKGYDIVAQVPDQTAKDLKESLSAQQLEQELADLIIDQKQAIEGYSDTLFEITGKGGDEEAKKVLKHISDQQLEHVEQLTNLIAGRKNVQHEESEQKLVIGEPEIGDDKDATQGQHQAFEYFVDFDEPEPTQDPQVKRALKQALNGKWLV